MLRRLGFAIVAATFFGVQIPGAAFAEKGLADRELAKEPVAPVSGWTFKGGLYGWFPWVGGTNTARGETFDVYATPYDLIESFDAPPIMMNFEARHGKLSFYGDVLYVQFAFGGDFASETSPIPAITLNQSAQVRTDYELGIYEFGGFYQIADFAGAHGNTAVELGAGARFIQQDFRLKARIDNSVQIRLGRLADRIEKRIRRIKNQDQRLESLSALNALRQDILSERIARAKDKGRDRRVARLERTLGRVDERGEALAALEAVEKLRLELLRVALNLNGDEFNDEFAFINSGTLDWTDPTIAMRVTHDFGAGHSLTAMGDFGGFNIDDGLSWQALLTYNLDGTLGRFQTTTRLGYKALWLRFEEQTPNGERGMDVVLHGPIAEFALRW